MILILSAGFHDKHASGTERRRGSFVIRPNPSDLNTKYLLEPPKFSNIVRIPNFSQNILELTTRSEVVS